MIMHRLVWDTFLYKIQTEVDKNPKELKKILDSVFVKMETYHSASYTSFFEKEANKGNLEIVIMTGKGLDDTVLFKLTKKTKDAFFSHFQDYLNGNEFFKR